MRPALLILLISLSLAGLVCALPDVCDRICPLREGIDSAGNQEGTNPGEAPASQAVGGTATQPHAGTPDENKLAIKALRTQVNSLAQLSKMVADHGQLLKANEQVLVGKHGDGGLQKTVNECQTHCDQETKK